MQPELTHLTDPQFDLEEITQVTEDEDGYTISMGSMCFFSPSKTIIPQVGDTAKLFGKGFGYIVRGLMINEQLVFYKTEEQEHLDFLKEQAERDQRKRDEYVANKDAFTGRISKLPAILQQRISRFQSNNQNFNWKFLPYELAVLEVTVLITERVPDDNLDAFAKADYKEQVVVLPEIDSMGLSGNQWGAATYYAKLLRDNAPMVVLEHGSLCPLVGCKEFGCVPNAG